MSKKKKTWLIVIGAVEVVFLIFALVVSIMVVRTLYKNAKSNLYYNGPFIGTLQNNYMLFFFVILFPVLVIFLADTAYLIVYATKKHNAIADDEKKAIEDEAKRQAREEVLKEIQAEQSAQKEQENKTKPEETKK
jgi:uncharacterized membrane protein